MIFLFFTKVLKTVILGTKRVSYFFSSYFCNMQCQNGDVVIGTLVVIILVILLNIILIPYVYIFDILFRLGVIEIFLL